MESATELVGAGLPGVLAGDGISLEGCGVRVEVSPADWGELPPYPGVAVVQPAVIPSPPRIKPETSEDERVQLCLQAYSLTCRRLLPGVWNPHDRHPLKPAERKLLLAAAEALCNHEVSPLRWVEFSVDQWRVAQQAASEAAAAKGGTGRKRKALARPPLKVVFAVSRIEEHAGWCRRERERRVQQVIITRSLRTVLAKWQQMRLAILRGEMTPSAARAKVFPGDSYQRQIDRAREEARREQARIATSIAAGEYLW